MRNKRTKLLLTFVFTFTISTWVTSTDSFGMQAADQPDTTEAPKRTVEPVFRVSKLNDAEISAVEAPVTAEPEPTSPPPKVAKAPTAAPTTAAPSNATAITATPHPLDSAVEMAHDGLDHMQANIYDYTAVMVKRERINGELGEPAYLQLKVRNERVTPEGGAKPFSVYMKFLKPRAAAGREVIWVQGRNDNKIIAHEGGGVLRFKRFMLEPDGWLAMKDNRHPIYDAGLDNLVIKLIEKAERDREAGICEVDYRENASINNRSCTMIQVVHDEQRPPYEFHKAQVFIDNELNVPVRYVAYDWPKGGRAPELQEEYTYINLKLNVGLTDMDFSPENPNYKFPK